MTHSLAWTFFILSYIGIAFGHVPGLALDRTGFAVLGAVAMIGAGILNIPTAMAAIDAPTILLLFGLMIVNAQLRLAGFHAAAANRLLRWADRPRLFLFVLMMTTAALSAFLVNDIVCLAVAPIATATLLRARLNPVPYLIGLACAANIGSGATLIGNPQNMFIGQTASLSFTGYAAWAIVPVLLSLGAAYALTLFFAHGRLRAVTAAPPPAAAVSGAETPDRKQLIKGLIVTSVMILFFFFSPMPREIIALVAAGLILCSRRLPTAKILAGVDVSLLLLFCGLFIVVAGFSSTGAPARVPEVLSRHGLSLSAPAVLTSVTAVLSNLVSNVPAVMLLRPFLQNTGPETWNLLALTSTFAGNAITLGSIANLITLQAASEAGITISFKDHLKIGLPVTLISLLIAVVWAMI